jgi:hypothetical protein
MNSSVVPQIAFTKTFWLIVQQKNYFAATSGSCRAPTVSRVVVFIIMVVVVIIKPIIISRRAGVASHHGIHHKSPNFQHFFFEPPTFSMLAA